MYVRRENTQPDPCARLNPIERARAASMRVNGTCKLNIDRRSRVKLCDTSCLSTVKNSTLHSKDIRPKFMLPVLNMSGTHLRANDRSECTYLQGWRNQLKPGGATFECSFTMLSRRRFAPPRSHLFTGAFQARSIMKSLQLI